jgi:hypothetical protein
MPMMLIKSQFLKIRIVAVAFISLVSSQLPSICYRDCRPSFYVFFTPLVQHHVQLNESLLHWRVLCVRGRRGHVLCPFTSQLL